MPCTFVSSLFLRVAVDKLDLDPQERATAMSSIEYIAYTENLDKDADEDDRNPASAATSELISPTKGDSTTPLTSLSVVSPLSPVFPALVRTKRKASGSLDDAKEKVLRLRSSAGGADHNCRLVRVVYNHKNSVDENGLPDRKLLPGEMIRPDGGASVPANREAAAAANAVYDLAEKALQGF